MNYVLETRLAAASFLVLWCNGRALKSSCGAPERSVPPGLRFSSGFILAGLILDNSFLTVILRTKSVPQYRIIKMIIL